jgi:hypothetical protein
MISSPNRKMMRKAIITFGVGYGFEHIKDFVLSCKKFIPDTDIYMFAGKNIPQLEADCSHIKGVHFIPFRENFTGKVIAKVLSKMPSLQQKYAQYLSTKWERDPLRRARIEALTSPLTQFMVKRFFLIKQLLSQLPHEQVMIADVRDIIFQYDPFATLQSDAIVTGIEPVANSESEMNEKWIRRTYSDAIFEQMADKNVACAGVTYGSRRAINQYIEEMLEETYENLPKIIDMLGADQAIHIRLFYYRLRGLTRHMEANGSGSIATLHFSDLTEFSVSNGRIENLAGQPLAVVHQYDRHPDLAVELRKGLEAGQPVNQMAS